MLTSPASRTGRSTRAQARRGGGAGTGLTNTYRAAIASQGGYQAKLFGTIRKAANVLWDGFADTSGINAARCLNHNVDTTAKCIKPSTSGGGTEASTGSQVTSGAAGLTIMDTTWSLDNGSTVTQIGFNTPSAISSTVKIVKRNSAGNYDVVVSESFSHPGSGMQKKTLSSPYVVPETGTYYIAIYSASAVGQKSVSDARAYKSGDITGMGQTGFTEDTGNNVLTGATYTAVTNNMKYSATVQTADAAVNSVTAFFEFDAIDPITLGADLTGIATCNNWSNSAAVILADMGKGQSGRSIVRAVALALTSGTQFAVELQFANNKNAPIYWVEVCAE